MWLRLPVRHPSGISRWFADVINPSGAYVARQTDSSVTRVYDRKFPAKQGGWLKCVVSAGAVQDIEVLPMWQEDVRIELVSVSKSLDAPSSELKPKALALCAHDVNANTVSVHVPVQAAALGTPQLRLYLPEIFSVQLDCHCDVAITDKLVGDVHVTAKLGDVVVNKLRGTKIVLAAENGAVKVKSAIEGSIDVSSNDTFSAKKVLAHTCTVRTNSGVEIGSLYADADCVIHCKDSLNITSIHAAITATSTDGDINMGGVSGSVNTRCAGNATIHLDALTADSTVTSTKGHASVSLSAPLVCALNVDGSSISILPGQGGQFTGPVSGTASHGVLDGTAVETVDERDEVPSVKPGSRSSGKISEEGRKMGLFASEVQRLDSAQLSTLSVSASGGTASVRVMTWIDKIRANVAKRKASQR